MAEWVQAALFIVAIMLLGSLILGGIRYLVLWVTRLCRDARDTWRGTYRKDDE